MLLYFVFVVVLFVRAGIMRQDEKVLSWSPTRRSLCLFGRSWCGLGVGWKPSAGALAVMETCRSIWEVLGHDICITEDDLMMATLNMLSGDMCWSAVVLSPAVAFGPVHPQGAHKGMANI